MITEATELVSPEGVPRGLDPATARLSMFTRAEITLRTAAELSTLRRLMEASLYEDVPGLDPSHYALLDEEFSVLCFIRTPDVFGTTLRMLVRGAMSADMVHVYFSFADDLPLCVYGLDFLAALVSEKLQVRFSTGNVVVPLDDDLKRAISRAMRSKHVCGND